jgi:hypothetical protein
MERLNPQEISHQPTNTMVLQGSRYSVVMAGSTVHDSRKRWAGEYDAYLLTESFSSLSGTGIIIDGDEPVLNFKIDPIQKIRGAIYDSHKPEYLSEIFANDGVTDSRGYADAVAEHILSLVRTATEQETISKSSTEPVWVTDKTGEVNINLIPFEDSLKECLVQKGHLPEDGGQFRLDA